MNKRLARLIPLAAVVLGLLALGWITASAELSSQATPIPKLEPWEMTEEPAFGASDLPTADSADQAREGARDLLPPWVGDVVVIAAVTVFASAVLAGVGFLLYRLFGKPVSGWSGIEVTRASQPSVTEMREALRAGLADIDAGADPRKAVIACWLRLERAAAVAGVERLAAETPDDLVRRVLTAHRVNDRALTALADAYRLARYAPHDVGDDLRDTARTALIEVDAQLLRAASEDDVRAVSA